ncbi:nucleoside/nucleotide kinase family protein [Microbacterium lacusdiani]
MSSRSSAAESFPSAHDAAFRAVATAVARLDVAAPRVLIDGRSGSGKTTLAARLSAEWPRAGERPQLVALDSLYPGWDGLEEGTRLAHEWLLVPHAAGIEGRWRRFDWDVQAFAEPHVVAPDRPLIVEGSGALTPAAAGLAHVAVWVDAPEPSRKARALERDGDTYAPHWDRWAAQEARHIETHDPRALADLVFDLL